MRYSMTLKNALNHFVNTTKGKQKPSESCTFSFGFAPAALENHPPQPQTPPPPPTPPLPPFFLIGVCLPQSLTWDTSPWDWSCRCEAHTPNIIRLAAPGEIRQGRGETGKSGAWGLVSLKSMHAVQVLISAPLNGHVLLKCLYVTTCLSRGLRAGSGQRGGEGGGGGGRRGRWKTAMQLINIRRTCSSSNCTAPVL